MDAFCGIARTIGRSVSSIWVEKGIRFCEINGHISDTLCVIVQKKEISVGERISCGCGWIGGQSCRAAHLWGMPKCEEECCMLKGGYLSTQYSMF